YKKWNTVGDACKMLSREFRFKFQEELPTLADYKLYQATAGFHHHSGNQASDRTKHWDATVRWLFTEAKYMPLQFPLGYMTVKEKTVDYTPAAVFTNKISVKETSFTYDADSLQWDGLLDESPSRGHAEDEEIVTASNLAADEPGLDISY